jgi:hypothetical protein
MKEKYSQRQERHKTNQTKVTMMSFQEKVSILTLMKDARQSIELTYNSKTVERCEVVQVINNQYVIVQQRTSFFSKVKSFLSIDAVEDIKIN